jgi:hypothetical protein
MFEEDFVRERIAGEKRAFQLPTSKPNMSLYLSAPYGGANKFF